MCAVDKKLERLRGLPRALRGAINSLIEQHVGHGVLDGKAPSRLRAHQCALDQRHLKQHAVKRLQEGVVLQLLLGRSRLGESRCLSAELKAQKRARARIRHHAT